MPILNALVLKPLPHRQWEVMCPFVVSTKVLGTITVPAGFVCDLNSLPRPAWFISPPSDFPEAGTVHDWIYRQRPDVSRAMADAVYRELLTDLGMGRIRRNWRYAVLRLFGRRKVYEASGPVETPEVEERS